MFVSKRANAKGQANKTEHVDDLSARGTGVAWKKLSLGVFGTVFGTWVVRLRVARSLCIDIWLY